MQRVHSSSFGIGTHVQIDPTIDQWRASQLVKIYADSLAIGVGYAGSVPFVLSFLVDVSGHLIDMP